MPIPTRMPREPPPRSAILDRYGGSQLNLRGECCPTPVKRYKVLLALSVHVCRLHSVTLWLYQRGVLCVRCCLLLPFFSLGPRGAPANGEPFSVGIVRLCSRKYTQAVNHVPPTRSQWSVLTCVSRAIARSSRARGRPHDGHDTSSSCRTRDMRKHALDNMRRRRGDPSW